MAWLWTIGIGVVTTLIATGIVTHFRKRRLFVVVSSLFRHSSLTDQGTIVQLSLINRGIRTEEDIEIMLDRQLTYELVASTVSKVSLDGDTLAVPRLSANDQIQFVLMADGGTFSPSSIQGVTSRETKGQTIESLEKVPASAGTAFAALSIFLALAALTFLGGYFARDTVSMFQESKEMQEETAKMQEETAALQAQLEISEEETARIATLENEGWRGLESFFKSQLAEAYPDSLPIEIGEISRDGDVVKVTIVLENSTEDLLRVSGRLISPAGESDEIYPSDRWFNSHFVMPNSTAELQLKAYLPSEFPQQMLIGDFSIDTGSGFETMEKRFEVPK